MDNGLCIGHQDTKYQFNQYDLTKNSQVNIKINMSTNQFFKISILQDNAQYISRSLIIQGLDSRVSE